MLLIYVSSKVKKKQKTKERNLVQGHLLISYWCFELFIPRERERLCITLVVWSTRLSELVVRVAVGSACARWTSWVPARRVSHLGWSRPFRLLLTSPPAAWASVRPARPACGCAGWYVQAAHFPFSLTLCSHDGTSLNTSSLTVFHNSEGLFHQEATRMRKDVWVFVCVCGGIEIRWCGFS